jgi:hypothetical protein
MFVNPVPVLAPLLILSRPSPFVPAKTVLPNESVTRHVARILDKRDQLRLLYTYEKLVRHMPLSFPTTMSPGEKTAKAEIFPLLSGGLTRPQPERQSALRH